MSTRLILALVAAAVLTIVPAVIEGMYVNRWGTPADLEGAAARVGELPRDIGTWKFFKEGDPLHSTVTTELGVKGYVNRTYQDAKTGAMVQLLLMVGETGRLVRHPPNICYAQMANEQLGPMTKFTVSTTTPPGEFNLLEYKRARTVTNDRFLVAYSMATDEIWKVPAMPRVEFGGAAMLYKVQLLVPLDPSQTRSNGELLLKSFGEEFCAAFAKHTQAANKAPDAKPAT
jgi:hypothetical protein